MYSLDILLSQFWTSLLFHVSSIVASWPAYRFLRRQIRWSRIPISLRIFLFVVVYTVKDFSIVNETVVGLFLEFSRFFYDPTMLAIWSLLPLTFLNPAWTSGFMVHVLLKSGLENFEHYFVSMWNECNCAVVWRFFCTACFWDWNQNWLFPVLWPLLNFPNLLAYWMKHFDSISF